MEFSKQLDESPAVSHQALPTGTLTFFFSDVEGSSALWEQQPEPMRVALARHDALLRKQVESNGGWIVKTTGDGLHAVFSRASQGVAVALGCQQALQAEDWGELSRPLKVRMGLHTGEAELRHGDYYGPAVNRASRLMDIAAGGQILLSSVTADLTWDDLPSGFGLRDLGEQRLRDLSRAERIFQLTGPGLLDEFPPLRTLNTLPNNLPLQLTSFVGREGEIAEVKRLLATTRLLTLIGPGGTGKTRLSLQVAADILEEYPSGVWWVELAPLADPALVVQTVAGALNVREQQGRPILDSLTDYLRPKNLLLILDNCEHLVEACAQLVARLLGVCPKLKILASTREALGVAGETAYRVPSLSLPADHELTPQRLLQSEAACLFVTRAKAAQPGFELTEHNLQAVAKICRRLDGIPLALELAAGRVRLLSVEQIAARLDDRFRLLTGGSRTALPRQQTLRSLIDWSYDLLDEPEQAAFRKLSVFVGGWTFEAAEALLGLDVLDLLARLVDKSLVVPSETNQEGQTRYYLLETIRQYGRDKLLESGESAVVRDHHLDIYLQLALKAEPLLEGPDMLAWLDRLVLEQDNFRAALEWGLDRKPEAALQIAASLFLLWQIRLGLIEGRSWLEQGLANHKELKPEQGAELFEWQALRAKGLAVAGNLAFAQGELTTARSLLDESAALARQSNSLKTLRKALSILGFVVAWLGDEDTLEAIIEEGLKLSQALNDPQDWIAVKSIQVNQATLIQGDLERAEALLHEIDQLQREQVGNPWLLALSYMGIANVAAYKEDYLSAMDHFQKAEKLFDQIGSQAMVCSIQSERAHLERRAGNFDQAFTLYSVTIPCWQELGGGGALAHELECLAFIAVERGYYDRAARLLGAAEAIREDASAPMRATEQTEYDGFISTLNDQLGQTELASAWDAGRRMTVDQVVDFALQKI